MPAPLYDVLVGILTLLFGLAWFVWNAIKKPLPYPPGPKRLPIVGNLINMPSREEWVTYKKWSEGSGSDIVHVDVMGTHIVILNSLKAGHELLDKRSSIYSDRPPMVAQGLIGMGHLIGFTPHGPTWRHLRREFHINFLPTRLQAFRSVERRVVHRLLRNLLVSPENFSQHLRHMAGHAILSVAYGIDVRPQGDPFVEGGENMLRAMAFASTSEASLFDTMPWLIHMPDWFPGTGFKRAALKWRRAVDSAFQAPYEKVKAELASGTAAPSVAANMISKLDDHSSELEIMASKMVPGTMYIAGTDTTVTALESFILAMTLYPEVQRKAQAEIDGVIGNERLPELPDEDALPYLQAVLKEVLRWHPVLPLSVPHRVTQSDIYEGYFIPAGSIVIPNVWGMLHDPDVFPDPDQFYPERWFSTGVPASPMQAFGFGARLCPGRIFAHRSIWETMAGLLAAFDITPTEDGPPERVYTSGIISYVKPFRCYIRPRSEAAALLVRHTEGESES